MKITFTKTLICCALLLLTFNLKAQKRDYVITLQGDTINCKVIGDGRYQVPGNKSKRINVDEIKEYYTAKNDILNRAVYLPGHRRLQFMTVVENGKINLYGETTNSMYTNPGPGGMTYYSSTTEWYIAKGTDTVKVLKNSDFLLGAVFLKSKKSRKNDLAEMLEDNKEVYDKFVADDKFSFKQIRNLVHLYNTGKSLGQQDYVITKNKDTIFCEIEPATFNTVSRYRANPDDRFTKIDTTITEYFLAENASTYLLKTLPKDKHKEYVKLLIAGRINLYSYSLNNASKDGEASLYASKGPGDLIQIKHAFSSHSDKNDKQAFIDLISDNPNLSEKVKNLSCDFQAILSSVKTYNSEYLANNKQVK